MLVARRVLAQVTLDDGARRINQLRSRERTRIRNAVRLHAKLVQGPQPEESDRSRRVIGLDHGGLRSDHLRAMTPRQWKDFYARERASLGEAGMSAILDRAPSIQLPAGGAIVFPHTRLTASGELIAAAAKAAVDCGRDTILALGVLHGRSDAGPAARRVHGQGIAEDAGLWRDEFSFDSFMEFVELYARRVGRSPPRVVARFPLLVGDEPNSLPGLDELRDLVGHGAALLATTDPIHHGAGYSTPAAEQLPRDDARTLDFARSCISGAFVLLSGRMFESFQTHASLYKSDFRDVGPVLATLLPKHFRFEISDLRLVDYADVLSSADPTWVAAALVRIFGPSRTDSVSLTMSAA
jgi:hypothetical protein